VDQLLIRYLLEAHYLEFSHLYYILEEVTIQLYFQLLLHQSLWHQTQLVHIR